MVAEYLSPQITQITQMFLEPRLSAVLFPYSLDGVTGLGFGTGFAMLYVAAGWSVLVAGDVSGWYGYAWCLLECVRF